MAGYIDLIEGLQHGDARGARLSFFHTRRAQSTRPDDWGTDVFLSLVDEDYRPLPLDAGDVLHVTALCSNRSRPEQILFGNPDGDCDGDDFFRYLDLFAAGCP